MANTLANFLVGIGWDTSDFDKGTRDIERSISGVKTTTLGVAAAILGVFGGVATVAAATAQRVDQLSLATQNLNTGKQFVANLGGAMKLMGGDAADALKEVTAIESVLSHLTVGELGPLSELATAGVDISTLRDTKTAEGFLSALADQIPTMTNAQKQLTQQALNLSDATMKAISGGGQQFEALVQRAQDLVRPLDNLTDESRILRDKMAEFGMRIDDIVIELSEKTLSSLIGITTWANDFINAHRQDISGVIETISEHPVATPALGVSAATTMIGGLLSKFGLGMLGGAAATAGGTGMILSGATVTTDVVFDMMENKFPGLKHTESTIDQGAREMGLGKLVDFSDWLFNTKQTSMPQGTTSPVKDVSDKFDKFLGGLIGVDRVKGPSELIGNMFDSDKVDQHPTNMQSPIDNAEWRPPFAWLDRSLYTPETDQHPMDMQPPIDNTEWKPSFKWLDRSLYTPEAMQPPQSNIATPEENAQLNADAITSALKSSPLKVANSVSLNVTLDGQALDSRITEVQERAAYGAIDDVRSSTVR